MTVIFAMRASEDALLIGADTRVIDDTTLKLQVHKLRRIPDMPVAWACGGNVDLGDKFSAWLEGYSWPPPSWEIIDKAIQEKVADLNGEQRRLINLSGVEWKETFGLSCLIVMWVNRSPYIEEYNDNGQKASWINYGFGAVGDGKGVAIVAYRTLEAFSDLNPLDRFCHILNTTADLDPKCGRPVDAWRVTQDGIDENPIVVEQEA